MKYFAGILLVLFFVACSSSENIQEQEIVELQENNEDKAAEAQSKFIDGTMLEMKGSYANAILEFQDALKLDPQPGIHYALAKNYYRLDRFANSLHHAKKAVEGDSLNVDYNYLLATIYTTAGLPDSSALAYQRIIKSDSTELNAYYNLAKNYENNKPTKALEVYKKLLDQTGPEWNVLVKIAEINEKLGDIEATISTVEELLELNPSNLDLQKLLIEAYIKNLMFDNALSTTEEQLQVFPEDVLLIEYKAQALMGLNRYTEAGEVYKTLIRESSINFEQKVAIGGIMLNTAVRDSNVYDLAMTVLETIDSDSSDWQVKSFLAEGYLMREKDSLAYDYFEEATRLAEWNVDLWIRLGGLLFDGEHYDRAIENMEKAEVNFPDHFAVNLLLGLCLGQQEQHAEAEPHLKKAADLQPNDFTANYAYGFTLNRLGNSDEALIYLKKTLNIDPDNAQIWGTIGMIYDNLGNFEKCDEFYEKAMSLDSTDALVLNNYAYSLSERGIQLDRALRMVNVALEADPNNASYLDTKGWIYFQRGDYENAEKFIRLSLDQNGDSAEVWEHLGDVYFKKADPVKALEYWKKALTLDESNENLIKKIEKGEI
ncbi:MAG: hypothetical protein SCALA702_23090 [Melioribacteraceae bacterium]|nr:MAG: hypothetical protein SCALA702_23090 [Melioribacteraceae bacterium]